MKIFTRQGRTSFLAPVVLSLLLALLLLPLVISPKRALAASLTQQSPADASCVQVTYTIISQWTGGFTAIVTITNHCSAAINGWILQPNYTAGQKITAIQVWNGSVSIIQSGSDLTIAGNNAPIPAGGSFSFSLAGTWSGSNPPPHMIFNGVPVGTITSV